MITGGISEGDWLYRKPYWAGPFTAYDRRTGITHETDAMTIDEARAFAEAMDATDEPAEADAERPRVRYTVERGSRARAGHQRYRGGEERTA